MNWKILVTVVFSSFTTISVSLSAFILLLFILYVVFWHFFYFSHISCFLVNCKIFITFFWLYFNFLPIAIHSLCCFSRFSTLHWFLSLFLSFLVNCKILITFLLPTAASLFTDHICDSRFFAVFSKKVFKDNIKLLVTCAFSPPDGPLLEINSLWFRTRNLPWRTGRMKSTTSRTDVRNDDHRRISLEDNCSHTS